VILASAFSQAAMVAGSGGGGLASRQPSRIKLSSRMVMPTDLWSWKTAKRSGVGWPPIRQPRITCNTMAAAISQCRMIATVE
jgi:hypothetical protein